MTRDDIIRMAREAGFRAGHIELYNSDPMPFVAPCSATDCLPEIERFAAIVAGSGAAEIEALRARIAEMERQEPIGWFTEDRLTDRSATTYDAATASRWAEKGWPVGCLYAGPGAPDGWLERGLTELENIRNRLDDSTLMNDKTLIERLFIAMTTTPEDRP